MKFLAATLILLTISCSSKKESSPGLPKTIEEAVQSHLRSDENRKRDMYRHPAETLTFFGIKPEMTVIEIWPSGGWYTEILAPYLSEKGAYIIADPSADPKGYTLPRTEWMKKNPSIAEKVKTVVFMPEGKDIVPDHTADAILTFRNVHNWLPTKNQEAAFKLFFKALKRGGVLGVVDHRANPKVKFNPESGYVKEDEIIRIAKKAGFILSGKSEINSNPKDSTNHPEGVWTLPPRLRLGEKEKAKYLAIGESDRLTLKFVKP